MSRDHLASLGNGSLAVPDTGERRLVEIANRLGEEAQVHIAVLGHEQSSPRVRTKLERGRAAFARTLCQVIAIRIQSLYFFQQKYRVKPLRLE